MKWTRYEILLSLCYNDGCACALENEKFDQTNLNLIEAFASTTADTVVAVGSWRYRDTLYQDKLLAEARP
jgi:hypothetical protein